MIKKYTHLNNYLAPVTKGIAVLFLLINILFWLGLWLNIDKNTGMTTQDIFLGLTLSSIHLSILAYALFKISLIFKYFSNSEWINSNLPKILKHIGLSLVLYAVLASFKNYYEFILFSGGMKHGFIWPIKTSDIILAILGLLVALLGVSMNIANNISQENKQIV